MATKYPNVPCAECGARADEPCVNSKGNDVKPHDSRLILMQAQEGQIGFTVDKSEK